MYTGPLWSDYDTCLPPWQWSGAVWRPARAGKDQPGPAPTRDTEHPKRAISISLNIYLLGLAQDCRVNVFNVTVDPDSQSLGDNLCLFVNHRRDHDEL